RAKRVGLSIEKCFDVLQRWRDIIAARSFYETLIPTSHNSTFSILNVIGLRCGRLATMARAAAQRHFPGNRPAQRMAQGRTETPLESGGHRLRLLNARRGR